MQIHRVEGLGFRVSMQIHRDPQRSFCSCACQCVSVSVELIVCLLAGLLVGWLAGLLACFLLSCACVHVLWVRFGTSASPGGLGCILGFEI